jgi:hypothetical protein
VESTTAVPQALPPQAIIMQMVMGGWIARAVSDLSRLNIPDVLKKRGPMTAAELVAGGIDANISALERVMRTCASVSIFTEDPQGKFGSTPLSDVRYRAPTRTSSNTSFKTGTTSTALAFFGTAITAWRATEG